jgi:hypothetical protein
VIRPDAERNYFAGRTKQRDIAARLDEAFDITFADIIGQLAFWLAEPKLHAKERFGLQQEILVIYSSHEKTDARVLTAIENIGRMTNFKHRIEKVLCLLIHNGDAAEAEGIVRSQTERIIVAFTAQELLDPDRGGVFVRAKIAKALGALDLFGMSSPIRSDRYFFGRDELVQNLINRSHIRRENSGLFGLRKTGKTSVLFALERRLKDQHIITEYLDCQNPGIHGARWWQVLDYIASRCSVGLGRTDKQELSGRGTYTAENAGLSFTDDIRKIIQHTEESQILVMFDEVEYVTHGLSGALGKHWDADFLPLWQTVRSVHQETKGRFSFIVAGVNPACVERSHFGVTPNPIFQLATPFYLEPLSVSNVRSMVRTIGKYAGLQFDEDVYAYLQETYGGHPYLIRIACSELWKACDVTQPEHLTNVRIADFTRLRLQIKARLAQPIKDILLSLVWWYPDEYDILQILASGDYKFVSDYLRQEPEQIIQFAKYGILRGDSGHFAIADVREFLNQYGDKYKQEISPFARTDMPPDVLPEVPNLELLAKLFAKRCELEVKLRKTILLYMGMKYNWDAEKIARFIVKGLNKRPDRQNPAELFVGRKPQEVMNELYTLDLKMIILENWDLFANLFDAHKTRFDMNMDTVNKARRVEGHTKPVTPEEAAEFENSYLWMLNRLDRVPV